MHFRLEKGRIEKHFPFLACKYRRNCLNCRGQLLPADGCVVYSIQIHYAFGGVPEVWVTDPKIEPSGEYHMYPAGNLCLYDPREMPWRPDMKIHETIIPWTAEWLLFYEIWKISGRWLGAEAIHNLGPKIAQGTKP